MMLRHEAIVLVTDGARMMLLCNRGNPREPELAVIEHREYETLANRDIMADAPGVGHAAGHPARTTFTKSDPHTANEFRFLDAAGEALAQVAEERDGDIVVVAPPAALGHLRNHYSAKIRKRLTAEIDKDYAGMPVEEIAALLSAARPPVAAFGADALSAAAIAPMVFTKLSGLREIESIPSRTRNSAKSG